MNTSEVKAFFEQTDVYLTYNYNLRIRAETVATFIGNSQFGQVLDMPCGTGDISAPFIDQFGALTLMDFSANMIATAKKRFRDTDPSKLRFVNADFYAHDFAGKQYDLVMNIGILAHISDPFMFVHKSAELVKPGGYLVIQNTDSDHWFAKLIHGYLRLRRVVGKDKYKLNKVSEKKLMASLRDCGFELQAGFRYNQSFLGFSRFFSNELKYKLTRKAFGYALASGEKGGGSDATFLLKKIKS